MPIHRDVFSDSNDRQKFFYPHQNSQPKRRAEQYWVCPRAVPLTESSALSPSRLTETSALSPSRLTETSALSPSRSWCCHPTGAAAEPHQHEWTSGQLSNRSVQNLSRFESHQKTECFTFSSLQANKCELDPLIDPKSLLLLENKC